MHQMKQKRQQGGADSWWRLSPKTALWDMQGLEKHGIPRSPPLLLPAGLRVARANSLIKPPRQQNPKGHTKPYHPLCPSPGHPSPQEESHLSGPFPERHSLPSLSPPTQQTWAAVSNVAREAVVSPTQGTGSPAHLQEKEVTPQKRSSCSWRLLGG